jgi:membrane-associated phospholipid phosphatase
MDLPLVIGGIPIIPINFSEPALVVTMRALSLLGTIPLVTLAALALALVLFWRRRTTSLIFVALSVGGGELICLLLKWLFAQPRPHWPDPLVVLTSAGFPSGHAMRSLLFFGILSCFLLSRTSSWYGRVSILLAGGGLVLLIGVSRVYLEAHSLSEVLAGYAVGASWLFISGITIQRNRQSFKTWSKSNSLMKALTRGPKLRWFSHGEAYPGRAGAEQNPRRKRGQAFIP